MKEFRKIHQYNCFSVHTPAQAALAEYLQNKEAYSQLGSLVQKKRDYFQQLMSTTRFTPLPSYGSYFQCYSYSALSSQGDQDFAVMLTKQFGVTGIPVSAFYEDKKDDKVIRFCFCKKEETLEKAVKKLVEFSSAERE